MKPGFEYDGWLCIDDLLGTDHPRQAFSGAQVRPAKPGSMACDGDVAPLAENAIRQRWREIVAAAHHDLGRLALLLDIHGDTRPEADPEAFARAVESSCDRLTPHAGSGDAQRLLPRACVLAGLGGRLIRDAYDYANTRVVMGSALIGYQLVCAKLADMAIADEIVEERLKAALDAPTRPRVQTGWRGVPALSAAQHLAEIGRCIGTVIGLYIDIHAGHAFVQRRASVPRLALAQSLLEGMGAVQREDA
ncbi:acyl-CoA dehydrogenase family protein [Trinickia caryophylli]|uniref:Acyl-CoA dehydrogenase, C-terminal domain n=1 Tax=Trinickia caryophylli TaxID=28094 RepID=A0A1X7G569_TRICW|nr:acyl-CoA dehydrogenase family protein [Trinickia caryophylli]PMS13809.1 hypothetical protein C0Z17_02770 [Trinickia caryophylli]TRX14307.1 hypothetical protein FNF07_23735 [Trinickia caryophylli]WQE14136.1 acyl-CoA dehydrogenase family protein [Trinickia caryophylli]SMF64218.1 Acyl-CoA dehydrogenase, C-terminal domain [Trinickia caryophylli]GLU33365.1 hypothetical protein Busp01_32070 [Trinickia caryophylli]